MTFVKEDVVPSVMHNGVGSEGLGCRDAFKLETWGLEGLKSDDPNFCNLCVLGAAIAATLYLIFGCEPAHGTSRNEKKRMN